MSEVHPASLGWELQKGAGQLRARNWAQAQPLPGASRKTQSQPLKKPGLPGPSAHLHVWGWDVSTAGCPRAGCVPFPGLVITNLSQRKGLYMIKIEAD